jgi:hypothetical protein
MPTLADYWRLKQKRDSSPRRSACMTFFDGPKSAMDRDDGGVLDENDPH